MRSLLLLSEAAALVSPPNNFNSSVSDKSPTNKDLTSPSSIDLQINLNAEDQDGEEDQEEAEEDSPPFSPLGDFKGSPDHIWDFWTPEDRD